MVIFLGSSLGYLVIFERPPFNEWTALCSKNPGIRCHVWLLHRYHKWFMETKHHMGGSENGGTPKSSISIGISIINHPFWGTPIFENTHIQKSLLSLELSFPFLPRSGNGGFFLLLLFDPPSPGGSCNSKSLGFRVVKQPQWRINLFKI